MNIKEALEKLQSSTEFKKWHSKNADSFLSHVFFMTGKDQEDIQIGYHNSKSDLVTTFEIKDSIIINPAEKVFKKPGHEVQGIDLKLLKINFVTALQQAEAIQKEKYSSEMPLKKIIILQNLDQYGLIYNITFVTATFKTLNIKINAEDGDVVYDNLVSIMEFPSKK